jgi:amidase
VWSRLSVLRLSARFLLWLLLKLIPFCPKDICSVSDLCFLTLLDVSTKIRSGALSPVELTKAELDRIAALDPKLKSYATVMADSAMAQAKQAEAEIGRGEIKGTLHGVPFAVKDLCWTLNTPTAAGMTIHKDYIPSEDATVVKRLSAAGAVILGKLQLTEGAYADHHPNITPPRNPWNAEAWPGASSSGSGVATAAGLCYGSLGSDTGGSIRFPSAANGVTGLKPTWGRVSRYGVFELAASLDHIGPMARSAADCGAILGVIAGEDPKDTTTLPGTVPDYLASVAEGIRGLRIGYDALWCETGVDEATVAVVKAACETLASLGATIVEIAAPDSKAVLADWIPNCAVETAVAHEKTYPSRKAEYGPALAGLIETASALSALDYQKILLRRAAYKGALAQMFGSIDLLLVPAQSFAAPMLSDMAMLGQSGDMMGRLLRFTCPFDSSGNPTITMPGGFTGSGLPIGFQLVGPDLSEGLLVRAGAAFQSATDWNRRHPVLS